MPKKYAICLHGLVGNIVGKSGSSDVGAETVLRIAHQHWDRYFMTPYNTDIFIHSWNTDLEPELKRFFSPKSMIVEKQKTFEIPDWILGDEKRKQNHYSKWYSNKESVDLMLKYQIENNFTYDFAMIARFDIAWQKPIVLSQLNPSKFYIGGWIRNPLSKVKDFWFIGSPKNIKRFSTIYDRIEEYNSSKVNAISKANGISNHKMAARHLLNLELDLESLLYCAHDSDGDKSDYPLVRYYYFDARK